MSSKKILNCPFEYSKPIYKSEGLPIATGSTRATCVGTIRSLVCPAEMLFEELPGTIQALFRKHY